MTHTHDFANGRPCWIDISVTTTQERESLMAFFGELFGWTFEVGPEETGYYTTALLDGRPVCAIGQGPDGPGQWVTYLATDDIQAAADRAAELDGHVFMGPMQVMDVGWLALGMDPLGALFGLWQKAEFAGFGSFGEPMAPCWFDHVSPSPQAAADFYAALFGIAQRAMDDAGTAILGPGDGYASVSTAPEGGPAAWMPIIAVTSVADTEARAVALGATPLMSAMPVPGGIASAFAAPGVGTVTLVYESPTPPAT